MNRRELLRYWTWRSMLGAALVAGGASAVAQTVTYSTPGTYSIVVPAGVSAMQVSATGAGAEVEGWGGQMKAGLAKRRR